MLTVGFLCLRGLVAPLAYVFPRVERRFRRGVMKGWGRLFAWTIGMKVRRVGTPPHAPFFLVSNHLGYIDTFLMAGETGAVFISRADVAEWPWFGPVARAINTIFIDRARRTDTLRVNKLIEDELAKGSGIVLYAEARTSCGASILPFKSSLLDPPARQGVPVHYCVLHYETYPGDPPAGDTVCWHTDIGFLEHVTRLLQLRGFVATVSYGPEPVLQSDRKLLAAQLHAKACEIFTPVQGSQTPE